MAHHHDVGNAGLEVLVAFDVEAARQRIAALPAIAGFVGGLLGGLLAWSIFNGYSVSTLGSNFSQVVFQFKVSPELLWNGLKWALGIGLVGGLFPALRAARLPHAVCERLIRSRCCVRSSGMSSR